MQNVRCRCGKIICQVVGVPVVPPVEVVSAPPAGPAAVILCRHCKRFVMLRIPAITGIASTSGELDLERIPAMAR